MGGSVGGRNLDFGVATWKSHYGQKRGRDMKSMSPHGLVSRGGGGGVATWVGAGQEERCRDPLFEVATWIWVATKAGCLGVSRLARSTRDREDMRTAVRSVRATCVLGVRTEHTTQF